MKGVTGWLLFEVVWTHATISLSLRSHFKHGNFSKIEVLVVTFISSFSSLVIPVRSRNRFMKLVTLITFSDGFLEKLNKTSSFLAKL